jgi:hypothetical protein|tara:strand:+ start:217 stop:843 length:627 start_codon:yes stop_codon:yes gene_type:complete
MTTKTTTTTTLDLAVSLKEVKAYCLLDRKQGEARAKKIGEIFKTGFSYTDCAASTTRLDKGEFAALKFIALQSIGDNETRQLATMSNDDYKAARDRLEGDAQKEYKDFRAKATAMAGPYLVSLGAQLLKCETPEIQKAVADKKAKAATDKKAEKAKGETAKTMQEKIIVQLTNTVAIMQGDGEPDGFDFVALQGTIQEALEIMGVKLV